MLQSETMDVPQELLHCKDCASGQAAKMSVLLLLKEMLNIYTVTIMCVLFIMSGPGYWVLPV